MSDLLRTPSVLPAVAGNLLDELRVTQPLTHCITNAVVTGFTANVLLAIGASPAMVDIDGEAESFAGIASGLLINLGTPQPEQRAAARQAVQGASRDGTPWVLDPVAIGALPVRTSLAHELVALRPTAIRGNASEILALAGVSAGGRGVDTIDATDAAADAARVLAIEFGSVVAVSGPVDLITDGARTARVSNGDALLTKVTGGGCALGATLAAFLGTAPHVDPFDAVVAASVVYEIAAEQAAALSSGPGSFAVAFLDALAQITSAQVESEAQIAELTA